MLPAIFFNRLPDVSLLTLTRRLSLTYLPRRSCESIIIENTSTLLPQLHVYLKAFPCSQTALSIKQHHLTFINPSREVLHRRQPLSSSSTLTLDYHYLSPKQSNNGHSSTTLTKWPSPTDPRPPTHLPRQPSLQLIDHDPSKENTIQEPSNLANVKELPLFSRVFHLATESMHNLLSIKANSVHQKVCARPKAK